MPITRGFKGRQTETVGARDRVPPGQYVTRDFPVLTAGPTQRTPLESWSLSFERGGELVARWSWAEFDALPQTERTTDIHCVTKWTKLDTQWRGVTFDDIMKAAGLSKRYHCQGRPPCARMIPWVDMVPASSTGIIRAMPAGIS